MMVKWKVIFTIMVFTLGMTAGLPTNGESQPALIEPEADRLLQEMSAYMAEMVQFSVQAESTLEIVLKSGQKIQLDSPANLAIQRPDKLRADRKGDLVNQELYYDGKSLSLYMPDEKYFATVEAPHTIEAALDFARESLDLFAPGGDLIYHNAYDVLTEDVISGLYAGLSVVGGVKCHHLAYRGNEVDWQIWIEDGEKPLPRKFVITSKWITGAPQFTLIVKNWNFSPEFTAGTFTFTPPGDAQQIDFIRFSGKASLN